MRTATALLFATFVVAGEPLFDVLVECGEGRGGVLRTAAGGSFVLAYRRAGSEATLVFGLHRFEGREVKVDPERLGEVLVSLPRAPPEPDREAAR